jgi:8-oxo-dGTP diphosphatase
VTAPVPTAGVICRRGDLVDGLVVSPESGETTRHYVMIDYAARWVSGEPVAGDDAAEAGFFGVEEALAMVEWDVTRAVIQQAFERFGAGREHRVR